MSNNVWVDSKPLCPLRLVRTQPSTQVLPPSPELSDITAQTLFDESFQPVKHDEKGYKLQSKEEDGLRTLCRELTKLFHHKFHAYQVIYHEELITPKDFTKRTVAYIIEVDTKLVCCSKQDIQEFGLHKNKCARISLKAPNPDLARLAPRTHKDYTSNDAHDVLAFRDLLGFATRKVWPDGDMLESMSSGIDTEYVWHPLLQKSSLVNHMKFVQNGNATHERKDGEWREIAHSAIPEFERYTGVYIKEFDFLRAKLALHGVQWTQLYDPATPLGMARGVTQWYVACSKIILDLLGNLRKYVNKNKSLFDTNTQSLMDACMSSTNTFDDKLAELVASLSRYYPSRLKEFCETMSEETTNRDSKEVKLQGGAKPLILSKWFFSTLVALGMLQHGAAHEIVEQLNTQDNNLANNTLREGNTTDLLLTGTTLVTTNTDGETTDPTKTVGVTLTAPTESDGVTPTDASSAAQAVSLASASAALVATNSLGNSSHGPKQVVTSTDPDSSLFRQNDNDRLVQMEDNEVKSLRQKLDATQDLLKSNNGDTLKKVVTSLDGSSLAVEYVIMLVASKDVITWSADVKHDVDSLSGYLTSLQTEALKIPSRDVLDNLFELESGRRILASLTHWLVRSQTDSSLTEVRDGVETCYKEGNVFYSLKSTEWYYKLSYYHKGDNPCDNYNTHLGLTTLQQADLELGDRLVSMLEKNPYSQVLRFTIHVLRGLRILEIGAESQTYNSVNQVYVKDIRDFVDALKDGFTKTPASGTLVELVVKRLPFMESMFECMSRRIGGIFSVWGNEDLQYAEAMYKCWRHNHLEYSPSVLGSFIDRYYEKITDSTLFKLPPKATHIPELVKWLVVLKDAKDYLEIPAQEAVSAVERQVSQQQHTSIDNILTDLENTRLGTIITKWRDVALAIQSTNYKTDFIKGDGNKIIKNAWLQSFPKCAWAQFDVTNLKNLGKDFDQVVTWINNIPIYDVESINFGRLVGLLAYFATFHPLQGQQAYYGDLQTFKSWLRGLLEHSSTAASVIKDTLERRSPVLYSMIDIMLHQTQDVPKYVPHWESSDESVHIGNFLFGLHTKLKPHVKVIPVQVEPSPSPRPFPFPPPSPSPPGGEHVNIGEKTLVLYEWADKPSSSFQVVSTQGVPPEVTRYLQEATLDKCLEGSGLTADQIHMFAEFGSSLSGVDSYNAYNMVMHVLSLGACVSGWHDAIETPIETQNDLAMVDKKVPTKGILNLMKLSNTTDLDYVLAVMPTTLPNTQGLVALSQAIARDLEPVTAWIADPSQVLVLPGNFKTEASILPVQVLGTDTPLLELALDVCELVNQSNLANYATSTYGVTFIFSVDTIHALQTYDEGNALGPGHRLSFAPHVDTVWDTSLLGPSSNVGTDLAGSWMSLSSNLDVTKGLLLSPTSPGGMFMRNMVENNEPILQVMAAGLNPELRNLDVAPSTASERQQLNSGFQKLKSLKTRQPPDSTQTPESLYESLTNEADMQTKAKAYQDDQGAFNILTFLILQTTKLTSSIATKLVFMLYSYVRFHLHIPWTFAVCASVALGMLTNYLNFDDFGKQVATVLVCDAATQFWGTKSGRERSIVGFRLFADFVIFGLFGAFWCFAWSDASSGIVAEFIRPSMQWFRRVDHHQDTERDAITRLHGSASIARSLVQSLPDIDVYVQYMQATLTDRMHVKGGNDYFVWFIEQDNHKMPRFKEYVLGRVGYAKHYVVLKYIKASSDNPRVGRDDEEGYDYLKNVGEMDKYELIECILELVPPRDGTETKVWVQDVPPSLARTILGRAFS